ncbi:MULTISPECIES: catechol 2,3-dioxygenase [Thauera]|jgi:catechol 2,3-dioxygenase|uniref:Metapyrocatechase n=4 Tax=Thauera aminoaromatica TaxID=164330 RepID=N6Z2K0_THASP|nr:MULTISPECIES: catechol 2,3-dioxygenase [Thauera]MDA0234029.1 catechol 2,3-dioxygenase [Pseudomonadota bacterium]ENO88827.1 catechol 2,3 dioxygenase [Thauera aminoaromatica S2]KIN88994.1 catechol 2,3 dioxygenase [Thauera sp. SWB20]MBP6131184.1 catechol 2,3-dioxygenase [Thauera sp.]MBP7046772.1 catechol 2,3-dioxygenase [Thauera sp.]
MAMTGVLRPGHISLRVLDLEEGINFYKNTLGLVETGRDGQGRVYFKAWDEREHNSVLIREAESAGVDFFAFKVADKATLDKLDADLQAFGLKTERIPAGEMLETGERVRFEVPSGHLIELYAEKTDIGNGQSYVNPDPWIPDAERGIAPSRMDHCLLYGPDIEKVQEIFEKVLGFYLVEHVVMEDGKTDLAIWLSCSTKAHDIAFVRHPEPGKLHHISFKLDSWEKVLRAADIMSMNRISIDIGPTRHGITRGTTIYAFDPSGNRFETFCGGYDTYPDYKTITWTWDEVGAGIFYHDRKLNERFLSVVS